MKKSKKFIFSILACFIAVFSFLIPVFINDNNNYAKADSVDLSYSFTGSNLFMFDAFKTNNSPNGWYVCSARNSFYKNYNDSYVYAKSDFYWQSNANTFDTSYITCYYNGSSYVSGDIPLLPDTHKYVYFTNSVNAANNNSGFPCDVILTGNFNGNVNMVTLGTKSTMTNMTVNFSGYKCFYMKYFDSDNNSLSYEFIMPLNVPFDTRTYYFSQDFSDSQIYQQGYDAGLLDNQQNIYDDGYSAGNTIGYNNGYQAGLNDSNQYSFYNLFGAVLDAPVQTLIGLLNFNLLGVNLFALFTGILTIIVFAFIIKTFKGGK